MPVLDPIDLELWNEYFREAIAGTCSLEAAILDAQEVVRFAGEVADEAIEEYQKRMKEVESK